MDIKGCSYAVCRGVLDSLRGLWILLCIDKELNSRQLAMLSPTRANSAFRGAPAEDSKDTKPIRPLKQHEESKAGTRTLQCCTLNGGVFLLSIVFFQYGFLPGLHFFLCLVFGETSFVGKFIWSWMQPILTCIFQVLWVLPLFLLSKVVNSLWFQDIADSAYRYSRGRPRFMQSVSILLADSIFSFVVQALFLIQTFLVNYIPIQFIGQLLSIVHMCMLYSLYAFEYKWFNMAWELHKRLTYIETNWPYFIGFGLPLAILTGLTDSLLLSGAMFAIFFPIFIVSANEANPVTGVCDYPLHLFSPVIALSNAVFVTLFGSSQNMAAPAAGTSRR